MAPDPASTSPASAKASLTDPGPSIFNDVLGPVMRGPSSSHCAASLRIGRMARDLMDGKLEHVLVEYDPNGSLVTTHKSQGSDMGLFGGLLGYEAHDERLPGYVADVAAAGIHVEISYVAYGATHPNTYKLTLSGGGETRSMTALSTGGGMIEIIEIEGATLRLCGDLHETLVFGDSVEALQVCVGEAFAKAGRELEACTEQVQTCVGTRSFVLLRSFAPLPADVLEALHAAPGVDAVRCLAAVLPVLTQRGVTLPFTDPVSMLEYDAGRGRPLWELAVDYEAARGSLSREGVLERMVHVARIMREAVETGLAGTEYEDRILGSQSVTFRQRMKEGRMVPGDALNRVIMFTSAIMEVKSSMGVIVAAPTAGSCGALPGAILGVAAASDLDEDAVVRAMLAAGLIGVFVTKGATFAAEVGGCMAECGAGSGMAAAGIVTLMGGTLEQTLAGASMALQNAFGLTCDPIANRVEAPCLGRNVMAASNALSCANMALADYAHLVPLEQVIQAMDEIGHGIPHELRCTGLGGLSITPASKAIEKRLEG